MRAWSGKVIQRVYCMLLEWKMAGTYDVNRIDEGFQGKHVHLRSKFERQVCSVKACALQK